jgi:hypothetical protein
MRTESEPSGIKRLEQATTSVLMLAAGSFVLSYDALHQLAVANHVPKPLAWIWPLIVDGFIITASLAVLHAVLRRRSALYPWLLVLAFSTMSIAFNVLHAPTTPVARLVAAVPPITLVLSFELLMRQLHDRLSTGRYELASTSGRPLGVLAGAPNGPSAEELSVNPAAAGPTQSRALDRARQIHQRYVREGMKLTGKTLGEMLGVPTATPADCFAKSLPTGYRRSRAAGEPWRLDARLVGDVRHWNRPAGTAWHCFHFRPLLQGHGLLRRRPPSWSATIRKMSAAGRLRRRRSAIVSIAGSMCWKNAL